MERGARSPKGWIIGLLVVTLTWVVYLPVLDGPFIWDDIQLITDSPRIHELRPLGEYFRSAFWARGDIDPVGRNYYRPLSILSLALDHALHGNNPGGYHLTNAVFHAANALLLFALLRRQRLESVQAGLLTLLWAWFPRLTEAAAWISGRTDVLATFFVLLGLLATSKQRWPTRVLAAVSFLFGLFAKEVALAGVAAGAVWEWRASRDLPRRQRLLRSLPLATCCLVYLGARIVAIGAPLRDNNIPWRERPLAALEALGRYTFMLVDGWHPNIQLGYLGDWSYAYIALGIPVLLAAVWLVTFVARARADTSFWTSLTLLAVSLFLVLHFIPITVNVVSADRFLYLPLAAVVLLAAPLARRPLRSPLLIAAAALCLSYAPVCYRRAATWADEVAFWAKAYEQQHDHNAMSRLELSSVYGRAGLHLHALSLLADADDRDYMNYLLALHNVGLRLLVVGRVQEATAIFEKVVADAPNTPKFHFALAAAYVAEQRLDDAERHVDRALAMYPDSIASRNLKHVIEILRTHPPDPAPDLSTVRGRLKRASTLADLGLHRDALDLLAQSADSEEMRMNELQDAILYAFDWGTPRQLTTLVTAYRRRGGHQPAIDENYAMRLERVRRLRELWPKLRRTKAQAPGPRSNDPSS